MTDTTATVVGDTPSGVLTGADAPTPTFTTTTTTTAPPAAPAPSGQTFSVEDIEKARKQEKDKLYDRLETLKTEVDALKSERDAKVAEEQRHRDEAEAALKKKAEEDMDVRTLLEKQREEFESRLESERQERERAMALLEQERAYQEIVDYRSMRIEQERDEIVPQLIDFVSGNNQDEIEQSIAVLKAKSAEILQSAQEAITANRAAMPGTRVTAPPTGPLDTESAQRPFSPDDIRNMSMSEYSKHRQRLLGQAGQERRGLFG